MHVHAYICSRYDDILNVFSSNLLMLDRFPVDKHHVWYEVNACPRRSGTLWPGQICHLHASNTSHHVCRAASASQCVCMTCKRFETRCNCRGTKLTAHTMMPCMHLIGGRECLSPSRQAVQKRSRHFHSSVDGLSPLHGALTFIFHHSWHKCAICLPCTREKAHSNILTTRILGGAKMTLSGRCEAGS